MATKQRRIEVGFDGGQVLALRITDEELESLRSALQRGGWHRLRTDDAEVELFLDKLVFIKTAGDGARSASRSWGSSPTRGSWGPWRVSAKRGTNRPGRVWVRCDPNPTQRPSSPPASTESSAAGSSSQLASLPSRSRVWSRLGICIRSTGASTQSVTSGSVRRRAGSARSWPAAPAPSSATVRPDSCSGSSVAGSGLPCTSRWAAARAGAGPESSSIVRGLSAPVTSPSGRASRPRRRPGRSGISQRPSPRPPPAGPLSRRRSSICSTATGSPPFWPPSRATAEPRPFTSSSARPPCRSPRPAPASRRSSSRPAATTRCRCATNVPLLGHEIDFLWADARLVVEADGSDHLARAQRDKDNARDIESRPGRLSGSPLLVDGARRRRRGRCGDRRDPGGAAQRLTPV